MRTHNSQSCLITTSLSDLADKKKSWDCSHCPCSPSSNKIKRHLALNTPPALEDHRPTSMSLAQNFNSRPFISTIRFSFVPGLRREVCRWSVYGQFMVLFSLRISHFQVGRGSFWMMFGTGTPQVQSWELCFRGHLAMLQHFRSQLPRQWAETWKDYAPVVYSSMEKPWNANINGGRFPRTMTYPWCVFCFFFGHLS